MLAGVAELVDAQVSKTCGSNTVRVRFPPPAHMKGCYSNHIYEINNICQQKDILKSSTSCTMLQGHSQQIVFTFTPTPLVVLRQRQHAEQGMMFSEVQYRQHPCSNQLLRGFPLNALKKSFLIAL